MVAPGADASIRMMILKTILASLTALALAAGLPGHADAAAHKKKQFQKKQLRTSASSGPSRLLGS